MPNQVISTPDAPESTDDSQAVKAGNTIYVAGTTGVDVTTGTIRREHHRERYPHRCAPPFRKSSTAWSQSDRVPDELGWLREDGSILIEQPPAIWMVCCRTCCHRTRSSAMSGLARYAHCAAADTTRRERRPCGFRRARHPRTVRRGRCMSQRSCPSGECGPSRKP
jgi:hypothetical protein